MNITDIDDKIIKRARQNHLFQRYTEQTHSFEEVFADCSSVLARLTDSVKNTSDTDKLTMLNNLLQKVTTVVQSLEQSIKGGDEKQISTNSDVCEFFFLALECDSFFFPRCSNVAQLVAAAVDEYS